VKSRLCPVSIPVEPCYLERLAEIGIEESVGSIGDAFDNAMA